MSGVKIQKVGQEAPAKPIATAHRHKSMRTYPRGVIKGTRSKRIGGREPIVPVKDPAKPPPNRGRTLRIMTDKGEKMRRKTIKQAVQGMSDSRVMEKLRESGIAVNPKSPKALLKQILEGGMEAGMIVAK